MSEAVSILAELNRNYILQNKTDEELIAQLTIDVNEDLFPDNPTTSSHIVFLLDASGSMDENFSSTGTTKREAVINTVESLLPSISDDDTVSIVVFETNATIVGRKIPGSDKNKIREAINQLKDFYGGTNFEAGLKAVEKVVGSDYEDCNIIFLTDGNNVHGSEANAKRTAENLSSKGVSITAMGIGDNFNFDRMRIYSGYSNSPTELIENLDKGKEVFEEVVENAQGSVIKKVKLNIAFPNYLRDIEFFTQTPEIKFLNKDITNSRNGKMIELNVGNLSINNRYNYILKCNMDTTNKSFMDIAEIFLTYNVPSEKIVNGKIESKITVSLSDNMNDEEIDSDIDKSYKDVSIEKLNNDFFNLVNNQEWVKAGKKLQSMIKLADEIGDNAKENIYRKKLKQLKNNNKLSQADLNELSYASSSSSVFQRGVKDGSTDDADF